MPQGSKTVMLLATAASCEGESGQERVDDWLDVFGEPASCLAQVTSALMRPAKTPEDFVARPVERWFAGPTYLVWSWSPELRGASLWGRPSEDDFHGMWLLVDAFHHVRPGANVITDTSQVESIGAPAYGILVEGMRARLDLFATRVGQHALVRSEGLLGALAEGFFPLSGAKHRWRVYPSAAEAFAAMSSSEGRAAHDAVQAIVDEVRQLSPALRALRAYLRANLLDATLAGAARALSTSERSLHRTLREQATGFREELVQVRIDAARRLLAETDAKVDVIARRIGFSSGAQLATVFGRTTGQTPTEFRRALVTAVARRVRSP